MSEIIGIYGLQGWGKTALTTYLGIRAKSMGFNIFSNYKLNIPFTPVSTLKEAQSVRNGYLLMDEFWEWVHARTSQSKINKEMMEICLLNRKRGVNIVYNSQLPRTIDVILREVTNYKYLPQMVEHDDGKKYVHYIAKDLIGRFSDEVIVPFPIDYIGRFFDTYSEVMKISQDKELTPRQKGDINEIDGIETIRKHPDIIRAYAEKNSGLNSDIPFDALSKGKRGDQAWDIKEAKRDVYITEYGKELKKKIDSIKDKKTGKYLYEPYFIFPVREHKYRTRLYDWWVLSIREHFNYLYKLNSMPRYSTLIKKSVKLSDMSF